MTSPEAETPATGDLTGRVAGGVRWSMLEMVAQQVVRLGITVVLTRLIAPADFGLLAMALVFTQLAVMLGDLGLGPALQQRTELTRSHISTATTVSITTGVLFALAMASAAPAIARFYEEQRLTDVIVALAVTFVLRGISTIPRDLLRRTLRFRTLALSTTTAIVVSGVVAVVAAVQGAGIEALVLQVVVENVAVALLVCVAAARASVWRPSVGFSRRAFRDLAAFGASVSGTRLAYYGANNIDNLIIGRVLGAAPLGLYNLAYRLMLFPVLKVADVIAVVTMPALASIKSEPERVAAAYAKAVTFVAAVCVPVSVATVVLAPVIVPAVFGDRWLAAVPVVQILAINGVRLAVGRMSGVVYEAMGRPHLDFGLMSVTFALFVAATLIGVDHGIIGVAWALTIAGHLLLPIDVFFLRRTVPVRFGALMKDLAPVALASGLVAITGLVTLRLLDGAAVEFVALSAAVLVAAVYLVALRLTAPALLRSMMSTALRR